MRLPRLLIFIIVTAAFASCGGGSGDFPDDVPTGAPPVVSRLDPTSGAAGSTATVFGLGFSIAAPINIIIMGATGASAETYSMLPNPTGSEIESLTFTVPANLVPGVYPVVVVVYDNASNADIEFTVTP